MAENTRKTPEEELKHALEILKKRDSLVLSKILEQIQLDDEAKVRNLSKYLYAKKKEKLQNIADPTNDEEEQINLIIDSMEFASLNHSTAQNTIKRMAISTEIANSVHSNIEKNKDNEEFDHFTTELAQKSQENLEANSKLSKVISETEELQLEIVKKKIEYKKLLTTIKTNWEEMEKDASAHKEETEEVKQMREKYKAKSKSIRYVVKMIQALYTTKNEMWASNPRSLQTLKMCEKYMTGSYGGEDIDEDIKVLKSAIDPQNIGGQFLGHNFAKRLRSN